VATIVPLILTAIKDKLTNDLQTVIPADDPARVKLVKIGRISGENPLKDNVYLAISPGDPEQPDWVDGIVTLETMKNIAFRVEPREIGGGQMWWRRGIIQVGAFYVREKYPEETATTHAYTVLGRVLHSITNMPVYHLTDEFGEQAQLMFLYGHTFNESGGSSSYIWRGKILWQCLTEQP
jgi:hypothetical protein